MKEIRPLTDPPAGNRVEKAHFTCVELKLEPMPGLLRIDVALAPAKQGVRTSLEIQIRLPADWLNEV